MTSMKKYAMALGLAFGMMAHGAFASEGDLGSGKGDPGARKERIAQMCQSNPEQCAKMKERHERFEKMKSENPEKFEQMKKRREEFREKCKANPEQCKERREKMRERFEERKANGGGLKGGSLMGGPTPTGKE